MPFCYVVGAGDADVPFAPDAGDMVIAADGGLATLRKIGIKPDLVIGDFDSLGFVPEGENVRRLPVEKDETDMAAALRAGFAAGYTAFAIVGGVGGRDDHTLANIQLLHHIAREGGHGFLLGNGFTRTVIVNSSLQLDAKPSGTVSVFSLSDESRDVTIRGLKYELSGAVLSSDVPLGVSNSFVGKPSEISVEDGALLIMWQNLPLDKCHTRLYNNPRPNETE